MANELVEISLKEFKRLSKTGKITQVSRPIIIESGVARTEVGEHSVKLQEKYFQENLNLVVNRNMPKIPGNANAYLRGSSEYLFSNHGPHNMSAIHKEIIATPITLYALDNEEYAKKKSV